MMINQSDISDELAEKTGMSKTACKAYTDMVFDSILKHLEDGDEVKIKLFGKFKMEISAPRTGRNIHTGELVNIDAKQKIKFTMSRALLQQYNSNVEKGD